MPARIFGFDREKSARPDMQRHALKADSALAQRLKLSPTQLGRKLAEAEAMGSLGWSRARGKSPLWVSEEFRHEYLSAQAVKLAIIDAAFAACSNRHTYSDNKAAALRAPGSRSGEIGIDQLEAIEVDVVDVGAGVAKLHQDRSSQSRGQSGAG